MKRPPQTFPTLGRNNTVRVGVCPDHPRAGRDVDVARSLRGVVISCFRCKRRLLTVRGPFRTGAFGP